MTDQTNTAELESYTDRVEGLLRQAKAITDDLKDLSAEMTSHGFDAEGVKANARVRLMDEAKKAKLREKNEAKMAYAAALGQSELFGG